MEVKNLPLRPLAEPPAFRGHVCPRQTRLGTRNSVPGTAFPRVRISPRRFPCESNDSETSGSESAGLIELAPSILSADFARLGEQVRAAGEGGGSVIHVDIMDGHFVPNLTIGPPVLKSLRKATELPLDCHLMIENPDEFIPAFADAGADWVSVHLEATRHLHRSLT